MLKKRIIPCLDIKDGRTVKGINFTGLRDAGDPVELARRYMTEGADELVFLDISATIEKRKNLPQLVEKIAQEISIPFTVGGGIAHAEDAAVLLRAGADKISINSAAVNQPGLIEELAGRFGSQCVVVAIDALRRQQQWRVAVSGGSVVTDRDALLWAEEVQRLGAGEILLTSMDRDGTKGGFDLELTRAVCERVSLPVIASGGAGKPADFENIFRQTPATGALAASIFHFGEIPIPALKQFLFNANIPIRWN